MSILENIKGCKAAKKWVDSQKDHKTAWDICERGDWMLRIAEKSGIDIRVLTRTKVECAKLVEHLMTDKRSINALRVAERFADGMSTIDELRAAAVAAAYAAYDVDETAFAAAFASAYAAYDIDETAFAAAFAVACAVDDVDDVRVLKQCADICREYIDFSVIESGLKSLGGKND